MPFDPRHDTALRRAWTPLGFPDLMVWLDASNPGAITLNGSSVSQWSDASGNVRHATQTVAANQPLYVANGINGKGVVQADTQGKIMLVNFGQTFTPSALHVFAVFQLLQNTGQLFDVRNTANAVPVMDDNGAGFGTRIRNNSNILASIPSTPSIVAPNIGGYGFEGTTLYHRLNGTQRTATISGTYTYNRMGVFGNGSSAIGTLRASCGEMLVLQNALAVSERERIEGYLAHKWGLVNSLPMNHPYKYGAPTA